jgi:hypothetical protein
MEEDNIDLAERRQLEHKERRLKEREERKRKSEEEREWWTYDTYEYSLEFDPELPHAVSITPELEDCNFNCKPHCNCEDKRICGCEPTCEWDDHDEEWWQKHPKTRELIQRPIPSPHIVIQYSFPLIHPIEKIYVSQKGYWTVDDIARTISKEYDHFYQDLEDAKESGRIAKYLPHDVRDQGNLIQRFYIHQTANRDIYNRNYPTSSDQAMHRVVDLWRLIKHNDEEQCWHIPFNRVVHPNLHHDANSTRAINIPFVIILVDT